ncbi:ABC transporter substrate-binding protein [Aneurinibacillus terranovensis]|uniref:ABC transporter substrate-binding protein n=1 Tax=Aneurinibacillus terranovensis TaxID=278991 RepID=UPI0004039227|nr:ABC transporter substrate-binding protein [Aneurinibacillus terranovensis]
MHNMRKTLSFIVLALLLFAIAGCGGTKQEVSSQNKPNPPAASSPGFPVTIHDSTGTEVKIAKKPERIVSIIPNMTEIAFALGLDQQIVGVSNYDDYPKEVAKKQRVGDLNINTEKVVSLQPDLVLADSSNGKAIAALRKLGIPVLASDAKTFDDIYASIETVGKATGTEDKAEQLVAKMRKDVKQVTDKVKDIPASKKPKVWVEVDPTLFTTGKGTFMNDMIEMAGGVNIASDLTGWKQLSEEKIIERNPDIILDTYGYYQKGATEKIKQRTTWKGIHAVQQGKVFDLDSNLVDRPGPRITDGLKQIAADLHPDLFK